ncbi:acetyltransferase-like isoleucine patch superfamily enzyme [Kribbella antiqua]|uniref:Acetyltransferase-like isoleucine patch superfamily enzyme n=1 Tax=Kribbella antiqua TaxID=2512217 RepID=A0A4R2IJA2_9ACTN|nr:acyltransferase [Kribbella antiqua]TCO44432.1 acetyltransferase-like isoleucine patch superfamily enzyme [Kribbella antiqua]
MRLLTAANLRWVVRHRAWTPYYLKRYWRFAWFKLRHPQVITEGFVFLGKKLEIVARPGHGRIILGKFVHLGDETRLRAHEGTLRIGDKVVFARDVTVNCYLDIEIGASTLIADWTYICDFDHKTEDLGLPIKDQGLLKSPVRIGPDCWLATKVTVTRGTDIGRGVVIGANSVARGNIPSYAVAAGVPAVVVGDRAARYAADAQRRAYLAGLAEANERTAALLRAGKPPTPKPGTAPSAGSPTTPQPGTEAPADPASILPSTSAVPGEAVGNDRGAAGDGGVEGEGFSSYSPVGHYVPHVRLDDAHDRLTVGEETRRG